MPILTLSPKQSAECYYVTFDFTNVLDDENISSADVSAIKLSDNSDVTSTITDVAKQVVTDTTVKIWLKSGTSGTAYKITCVATCDGTPASKYEVDALLSVVDI